MISSLFWILMNPSGILERGELESIARPAKVRDNRPPLRD
jgi:hypothetical protein